MWIQELQIKNFGKFTDKRIELASGINVIYGENESGKSTLHAYIRGCLFGIRKMRGRASKTDVFSRYQPWNNPAYYAGTMRFVCGRKVFRLERDFTKGVQAGVLVCETDGECLSLENGDLEMLLGNIGEAVFDNTVSIGQLKNETDEGLVIELKNYMANLSETGHSSIRVEKAQELLRGEKRRLEKQLAAKRKAEEEKQQQIYAKIAFMIEEQEKEEKELERIKEQIRSLDHHTDSTEGQMVPSLWKRCLLWLKKLFFGWLRKNKKTENTASNLTVDRYQEHLDQRSRWLGKKEHLENQILEKKILIENGEEEIRQLRENCHEGEFRLLEEQIEACDLAMERIRQVVSRMQTDVGQFLKKRTSEIFEQITQGKYQWVEIQEDMKLGVHGKDHYISMEQLSRGTIWQLYFALRMAANEVLGQEESLPVLLDDAFVMYDDLRLGQVLDWLSEQKRQVLIFTCQKREQEWLMRKGIPFHQIQL